MVNKKTNKISTKRNKNKKLIKKNKTYKKKIIKKNKTYKKKIIGGDGNNPNDNNHYNIIGQYEEKFKQISDEWASFDNTDVFIDKEYGDFKLTYNPETIIDKHEGGINYKIKLSDWSIVLNPYYGQFGRITIYNGNEQIDQFGYDELVKKTYNNQPNAKLLDEEIKKHALKIFNNNNNKLKYIKKNNRKNSINSIYRINRKNSGIENL
jgi:hypothetical protein